VQIGLRNKWLRGGWQKMRGIAATGSTVDRYTREILSGKPIEEETDIFP
jgi:hypothetical protein